MALLYHYSAALGRPFLTANFIFQSIFMTEHTFCDIGDLQPVIWQETSSSTWSICLRFAMIFGAATGFAVLLCFCAQFSNIFPPILRVHYHTAVGSRCHVRRSFWTQTKVNFLKPGQKVFFVYFLYIFWPFSLDAAKRVGLGHVGPGILLVIYRRFFCDLTYVRAAVEQKQSAYAPKT